jgi:leucyl aminopeptidase
MKISVNQYSKSVKFNSDTLAVFHFKESESKKKSKLSSEILDLDKSFSGLIAETLEAENFDFALASVQVIGLSSHNKRSPQFKSVKKIIVVGLGEKNTPLNLRKVYASLLRSAKDSKTESLAVFYPENPALLAESSLLISYEFDKYKSKDPKNPKPSRLNSLVVYLKDLTNFDKKAFRNSQLIAEATCIARDLVWEPACVVTPSYLAEQALKIKAKNITVTIKEAAECKKLGMGAFLAVAQGADEPPKFIEISYIPLTKVKKHICLIGKGVTFDSGGLSLKPAKSMEMMKEDMSGSAAIIGIMNAIAKIQPSGLKITAIIAATENMPSGKAYKPGDVIKAMNGKTIEVNNTDAEGRLTLADAVTYASLQYPDEIIDFATLTGACMVALGNICAGLMGNDQDLIERIKKSSENSGELMWQLPLYDEYKKKLKSPIADLINAGSGGQAGAQNGALFINEFVGKQKGSDKFIPWAHIDIAGPCWFDEDQDWSPKGASGIPVRTILDYLLSGHAM